MSSPFENKLKEDNFLSNNICHICFLYHFDLGSEYLINGIHEDHETDRTPNFSFSNLQKKIEETIRNELIKIYYHREMKMKTPTHLRKTNPPEYPINKGYLSIEITLQHKDKQYSEFQYQMESKEFQYQMELVVAHIDLFDTGVATVNLQFEIRFKEKVSANGIKDAYQKIYAEIIEQLKAEKIEPDGTNYQGGNKELSVLKQVYEIIRKIREKCKEGKTGLYKKGEEWTLSPYPLFCLSKIEKSELENLPLLELKSEINNSDNKSDLLQYSDTSSGSTFIAKWNAALLVDSGENIQTYVRLLELCSYIWLSAFLFRSYLISELDNIPKPHDNIDERISEINKLRIRSIQIQQIKYQSLLSLWENSEEIFDNVLEEAWSTEKTLYTKIGELAEFLDSRYQYLHDQKQNKLNTRISNRLSLLQIMSIPLTIAFALLTWSPDSSICYLFNEKTFCEMHQGQDVIWLLSLLLISVIVCVLVYYIFLRSRS